MKERIITLYPNHKPLKVKIVKKAYYNRVMSEKLKNLLKEGGKFHWLIDYVKNSNRKELDFQNTENQFSIYRGTSKILTLHENEKIDADRAYMNEFSNFYENPNNKELFENLIKEIDACPKFDKFIKNKNNKTEGWYQSAIGRRYSFGGKQQGAFIVFDKELMIHNSNKEGRREELVKWRDDIITEVDKKLQKNFNKLDGTPRKLDLVGISLNGDLWLIEVKQDANTSGIYNSPIQIGMYYKRIYGLMDTDEKCAELQKVIIGMLEQKQELGLINENWELPKKLSGKIKLAVVVGGKSVNPIALEKLPIIKGVVEQNLKNEIAYYSCYDNGKIEEVNDFDATYLNSYSDKEKVRQVKLLEVDKKKDKSDKLFYGAEGGGVYGIKRKTKRSFVLRESQQDKNLFCDIREVALKYFNEDNLISWHAAGQPNGYKGPSGHILSSQIACLNHLFAFREDADAVRKIINGLSDVEFKTISEILCDKGVKRYIAFEVIDKNNNLRERGHRRGSYCTSIDSLVYGVDKELKKWIILIEWKYTETYGNKDFSTDDGSGPKGENKTGKVRMKLYNHLIQDSEYLKKLNEEEYQGSVYYREPFYQLMRQTLWAEQMIDNKSKEEIKADKYLHIHVIPRGNKELLGKGFPSVGDNMEDTWKEMLTEEGKERYITIDPVDLLAPIVNDEKLSKKYSSLIDYLSKRYWDIPSETIANKQTTT